MRSTFEKRGRLEIIYEVLSVCRTPTNKTHILYRCNLSYAQLQKYLTYLISHGLLSSFKRDQREFFEITERGKEFLERYELLEAIVETNQHRKGKS
jgi:predicted transcriptional regulator